MAIRVIKDREAMWNVDFDTEIDRQGAEEKEEEKKRYMEQVEKNMG